MHHTAHRRTARRTVRRTTPHNMNAALPPAFLRCRYNGLPLQLIVFPAVVYFAYASYMASYMAGAGNGSPFMSYQSLVDWMLAQVSDEERGP